MVKKECFRFRQVFHIEHIVPINVIIDQLLSIDLGRNEAEVYKKIDAILDKIYVCYMLKEENANLNHVAKSKKSDDYRQVLDTNYKKAGIVIKEYLTKMDSQYDNHQKSETSFKLLYRRQSAVVSFL